ncbi:MAG: hypothetical protein H7125_02995 [Proteobacteria bacterium]|nr:hypothetical protein [Burkholderiales bacterium]
MMAPAHLAGRLRNGAATLVPRMTWAIAGVVHRLGWIGLGGVALLVLGVAVVLYSQLHLEPMLELERSSLEREVEARKGQPSIVITERQSAPTTRLETFYEAFPDTAQIPNVLGVLVKLASRHQLKLEQGQYRLAPEAGGPLLRYQVKLPITGAYPQLRTFVEDVLHEVPSFALDSVQFRRESIGAPALDAEVEFSLYVRAR